MKFLLSALFMCAAASLSFGQGRASIGPEVAFPTGSNTEGIGTAIGGSFRYEAPTKGKNLNWLASVGYLSFPVSENVSGFSVSGHVNFLSILMGLKYYPKNGFDGFYIGADAGLAAITAKVSVAGIGSGSSSDNKFQFSPGLGYHFKGADLGFKYNIVSDANFISIRLGLVFN
jgi:hypothetical protein